MSVVIRVYKQKRLLEAFVDGHRALSCRVQLGFGADDGPKRREGDGRTPEGVYFVCTKNASSRFYRSLGEKPRPSLKFQAMFRVMREIDKKWPDGHIDKEYWRRHGWLDGKYPWKQKPELLE